MSLIGLNQKGLLEYPGNQINETDYKEVQQQNEDIRDFILRITSGVYDRKKLTVKDNIELAKRMLVDNVYKAAKLENIAVTYAATIEIVELGKNSGNLTPEELTDVVNLKRSWEYLLNENTLNRELGIDLMQDIHGKVAFGMANLELSEMGNFRRGPVGIFGTTWRPKAPNSEEIYQELQNILTTYPDVVDRALEIYIWMCKRQAFKDGNKRTSNYFANQELIKKGFGILSPPPENDLAEFRLLLINYYETDEKKYLKEFLLNKCYSFDFEGLPTEHQGL